MENTTDSCQVLVCNIHWGSKANTSVAKKPSNRDELPDQISLDIPAGVMTEIQKKPAEEYLIVESFVLNLLYKKFGYEVNDYQIWLPSKS